MRTTRLSVGIPAAIALAALGFLAGCGPDGESPAEGTVLIHGAGATFPVPLYRRWFRTFANLHREANGNPSVLVDYRAVGSGSGEKLFLAESVDFGATDAGFPGADAKLAALPRGAVVIPVTAGSVVLVYNLPRYDGELRLSREALAGIFLGEIRRWDDPRIARANPGRTLPAIPVAPVHRTDGSGTTWAFTSHLAAISTAWRDGPGAGKAVDWPGEALGAAHNEGVAGLVRRTPGGIGYVAYEFSLLVDLPRATLLNRSGRYVAPTPENAQATLASVTPPEDLRAHFPDPGGEDAYPIVTFSWIAVYGRYEADKARWIRELLRWCLTEGQKDENRARGYVPLAPAVAAAGLRALERVRGE